MAVPVDAADDVGGQRPAGVLADVLSLGAHLRVLGGDRVGDGGIDGTRQVDEGVLAGQFLAQRGGVRLVIQQTGDPRGDLGEPLGRIRRRGIGCLGVGELLLNLQRLEGQRPRLDGERQLVVIAVDDAAAHRLLDVGDLELTRGLGAQARRPRHLEVEQLRGRNHQQQRNDRVAHPVPEDERRRAHAGVGRRLPGATGPRRMRLVGARLRRGDLLAVVAAHAGGPGTGAAGT